MKEWNGGMMVHLRYHLRQGYGDQRKLWWIKNNGIMENAQVKREYI